MPIKSLFRNPGRWFEAAQSCDCSFEFSCKVLIPFVDSGRMSDDDDVPRIGQSRRQPSRSFLQSATQPIAYNGFATRSLDLKPETTLVARGIVVANPGDEEVCSPASFPTPKDTIEVGFALERRKPTHGVVQAVSRLRPRWRRALMTRRPPGDAMRFRKPWRLARLRLLGWNVRFIAVSESES